MTTIYFRDIKLIPCKVNIMNKWETYTYINTKLTHKHAHTTVPFLVLSIINSLLPSFKICPIFSLGRFYSILWVHIQTKKARDWRWAHIKICAEGKKRSQVVYGEIIIIRARVHTHTTPNVYIDFKTYRDT